uniref:STAS domain-containing protein n=1 Tax=Anopheles christyi TaxID=43041 RepID=A0A182K947_9DIPT
MFDCELQPKTEVRCVTLSELGERKQKPLNDNGDAEDDCREKFPSVGPILASKLEGFCNRKFLTKRLPILQWLPTYEANFLVEDIVAGLSVGLTVIPQGIAFAVMANLEPQYGLYSAFMGCFVYCVFGSCKDLTIGPTAIMALMVQVYVGSLGADFAVLLTFLTGCIILMFGLLNLGFLVQFISMPVTAGFTSAAAITIASGQVKSLLGLPGRSNEFVESWINVYKHIEQTKLWDAMLGFATIGILLLLRSLRSKWSSVGKYLALSRNAVVVIGGATLAYYCSTLDAKPFSLTGTVTPGLPPVRLPPFTTVLNNQTLAFNEMTSKLGSSIIALPLIAILETIAIVKAFSKGKSIDATQELVALGMCNIFGSIVSSMPITGSFTRTAVNNNSGVRTPLGGIVTGILVLLSLGLLTDTFYFIPKSVLAGVMIAAMFFMIEFHAAVEIWRTKKVDIIPFVVTLVSCLLLGLEYGMLIGIALNICFVLYMTSRPSIDQAFLRTSSGIEAMVVKPDQSLIYSSIEYLKHEIVKRTDKTQVATVIIDGSNISYVDSTAAKIFSSIIEELAFRGRTVLLWNWNRSVRCTLIRLNKVQFHPLFKNGGLEQLDKQICNENEDIREHFPQPGQLISTCCRGICTRKQLFKRFPILQWLPSYRVDYLVDDIVAGLSVALTVIPQGIAYAAIANLDPQYGLYSAFMGCFIYCILGSCKDVTIGPTAIMSLMINAHVGNNGPELAILSAFVSGCVILLLGILNLGFLVQFISFPVSSGFTSAAAITIASGQVKSLLGISAQSNEFLDSWINVFENIQDIRLWDSVLGIVTIVLLLVLMQMKNLKGNKCWRIFGKYIALSRNAIAVISGTLLAYILSDVGKSPPFQLIGNVTPGLPPIQLPPFSTIIDEQPYSFFEMIAELGTSVISLPLIAILESVAIAKAFSKGKAIDATQEMIALGVSNIAGSFVSSMPVTGSFTRSAVNNNSGIRTQLGGITTGTVVLLALGLLTNTFYYIPKASLAAVIIAAMFFMVEFHAAAEIWRTKRVDIFPMMCTLVACLLLGLEYGMIVGIGINVCIVLYQISRPSIESVLLTIDGNCVLVIQPDQSLIYSSAEYLKHQLLKQAAKHECRIIVLDGSHINSVDTTVAKVLVSMTQDVEHSDRKIVYWKWSRPAQCTLLRLERTLFQNVFSSEEKIDVIIKELIHLQQTTARGEA